MRWWIGALLLWTSFLGAQQPAASRDNTGVGDTVFSVGTTLIQVDAEVTDSKQRHVTDLRAEDFEVILDHKAQTITNVSYVNLGGSQADGIVSTASNRTSFVVRPENVRRSLVMVVDDLGLSFQSMVFVRRGLHKFIDEQMQPGDLVAVWETGRTNSVFQQLTSDKHTLAAAVDSLRWNPRGRGLLDDFKSDMDASQRDSRAPESHLNSNEVKRPITTGERDERAYVSDSLISGTVETISELVEELRTVGGRKALVLFADGLYLPTPSLGSRAWGDPFQQQILDNFRHLIDNANRSGTVIYTVDARGLEYLEPDKVLPVMESQQGLVDLAEKTGGFGTVNANTFTDALQHIEEDQQGYYLIGFKAPPGIQDIPGTKKFDFHTLHVNVKRPGLHIRSRAGFWGETDRAARPRYDTPQAQMRLAALSLFNRSEIHIRLTPIYTRTADARKVVRNFIYVDARDVTFKPGNGGKHSADLDLMIISSLPGGDSQQPVSRHIAVSANDEQLKQLRQNGILLTMNVPLKQAGPYQIRASVRDRASAAFGSAGQYIDIPDLKKQHLALTTPVLKELSTSSDSDPEIASPVLREFHTGSSVSFVSLIETDRDEVTKLPSGDFEANIQLYSDGKPLTTTSMKVLDVQGQNVHAVKGELRLKDSIPPGQYYLKVTAMDHSAKIPREASAWIDFQVLPK